VTGRAVAPKQPEDRTDLLGTTDEPRSRRTGSRALGRLDPCKKSREAFRMLEGGLERQPTRCGPHGPDQPDLTGPKDGIAAWSGIRDRAPRLHARGFKGGRSRSHQPLIGRAQVLCACDARPRSPGPDGKTARRLEEFLLDRRRKKNRCVLRGPRVGFAGLDEPALGPGMGFAILLLVIGGQSAFSWHEFANTEIPIDFEDPHSGRRSFSRLCGRSPARFGETRPRRGRWLEPPKALRAGYETGLDLPSEPRLRRGGRPRRPTFLLK